MFSKTRRSRKSGKRSSRCGTNRRPLRIEPLEDRRLLAVGWGDLEDTSWRERIVEPDQAVRLDQPSRTVIQWIDHTFYRWSEYEVGVDGKYFVALEAPQSQLLPREQAIELLNASQQWMLSAPVLDHAAEERLEADWLSHIQAIDHNWLDESEEFLLDYLPASGGLSGDDDPLAGSSSNTPDLVADTTVFPFHTIGYHQQSFGSVHYRCTSIIVSPHTALTSAHCVYNADRDGYATSVQISPGQYQEFGAGAIVRPFGRITASGWETNDQYIQAGSGYTTTHTRHDYAAVFYEPSMASIGLTTYVPLQFNYDPPTSPAETVYPTGYPFEVDGVGTSTMWEMPGPVTQVENLRLIYDAQTAPGSSGSPVWSRASGQPRVIALHGFNLSSSGLSGATRLTSSNQTLIEQWLQWIPDAAIDFHWDPIEDQSVGNAFPVTITARDSQGTTVTSFTDTVDLAGFALIAEPGEISIGQGDESFRHPFRTRWHDSRTQVIYLQSEVGQTATISGLALDVVTIPGQELNDWTIRMKHTSLDSYATASLDATDWVTVYQAKEPRGSTGWRSFEFTTPFEYNGLDNLMIDFSHNNSSWTSDGRVRATDTGTARSALAYSDSNHGDPLTWSGTTWPNVSADNRIPNIRLTFASTSIPVSIAPTVTGEFIDGVWAGSVTVNEPAEQMFLRAEGRNGRIASSNLFPVTAVAFPALLHSLQRQDPATSPTNADVLVFRVTFSGAVQDVDGLDFVVQGATTAKVTDMVAISDAVYDVTVSGGDLAGFNGGVGLALAPDFTIVDLSGNRLMEGPPEIDESYLLDNEPPVINSVDAADVVQWQTGQADYWFTIEYSDNVAIDVASLADGQVTVSGPSDFYQQAQFLLVDPEDDGTPRTVSYRIIPPGGSWDASDRGQYTIALNADQVLDTAGNAVQADASLASFQVHIRPEIAHTPIQLRPTVIFLPHQQTVVIDNPTDQTVMVLADSLDDPFAIALLDDGDDSWTIPAGQQRSFLVTFAPDTPGLYEAALSMLGESTLLVSAVTGWGVQDWQNPVNRFDVDGDGTVTPSDVLMLINEINFGNRGRLPIRTAEQPGAAWFPDVNGDGSLIPLDVLMVVHHLNHSAAIDDRGEGHAASFASDRHQGWDGAGSLNDSFLALSPTVASRPVDQPPRQWLTRRSSQLDLRAIRAAFADLDSLFSPAIEIEKLGLGRLFADPKGFIKLLGASILQE